MVDLIPSNSDKEEDIFSDLNKVFEKYEKCGLPCAKFYTVV